MTIYKDYKIEAYNSTVCGWPGRDYDWSKFCWDGSEIEIENVKKGITIERPAPIPWADDGLIGEGSQYLHVPFMWSEQGTIYRVRPNETMRAGETYRRHKITKQEAISKDGGWYWRLWFSTEEVK